MLFIVFQLFLVLLKFSHVSLRKLKRQLVFFHINQYTVFDVLLLYHIYIYSCSYSCDYNVFIFCTLFFLFFCFSFWSKWKTDALKKTLIIFLLFYSSFPNFSGLNEWRRKYCRQTHFIQQTLILFNYFPPLLGPIEMNESCRSRTLILVLLTSTYLQSLSTF